MKRILVLVVFLCLLSAATKAQQLDEVINFMKANPKKSALYLIENDQTTVAYNSNQAMPLASAVKTMIAITFAKQAAANQFSPQTKIATNALARYYIPNTDGGAFPNWIKSLKGQKTDSITLMEIAKGMIEFSANANTEFLQDFLGMDNINQNIAALGMTKHEPLYYFTAGAIMACLKPDDMDEGQWIEKLKAMPIADYRLLCKKAHERLKTDPTYIQSFHFSKLSMGIQRVWSDRLVAATTKDYALLMQKIGSSNYFEPAVQRCLTDIMEWPMAYPENRKVFDHLGQKGGSTAFVLTDAFYAKQKNGDQVAAAFFFTDLTSNEQQMINRNFGAFEANIITNKAFRTKLSVALK